MQSKVIGRMPTDHGPYVPGQSYGKKYCVELYGCVWESKHDNNNTAPATLNSQAGTITPHTTDWKKVIGSTDQWLIDNGYKNTPASHVTDSNQNNKTQQQINTELKTEIGTDSTPESVKGRIKSLENSVGSGGSVDQRIAAVVGDASQEGDTLEKLENRLSPVETAVGSGGSIDSRISAAVSAESARAQAAEQNLRDAYAAIMGQSGINMVIGTLPVSGVENVIYRQPDPDNDPPQFYSDYMWDGTRFVKMAQYDNAIDDVPTAESNNLVKSGGVYDADTMIAKNLSFPIDDYVKAAGYLNPSTGKFGNTDYHSVIPVNEGQQYILSQGPGAMNPVCYAFATSSESVVGGDIPLVSGTSVTQIGLGKSEIVTIPSGCTYLLFSWGGSWKTEFYGYFDRIEKEMAVKRYIGMTGSGYNWLYEVDIPSGSVIRNIGEGTLTLYNAKDDSATNVVLSAGQTFVSTFDIKWIRGRSSTSKPFEVIVYRDKDSILLNNGSMTIKDGVIVNSNAISGSGQIAVTIATNFTFGKLPYTLKKGSIIKSITASNTPGYVNSVIGTTNADYQEEGILFTPGQILTKDVNYLRGYADTYTFELECVAQHFEDEIDHLLSSDTFTAQFTGQYSWYQLPYILVAGTYIESITIGDVEVELNGYTTRTTPDSELVRLKKGITLTKNIGWLRNFINSDDHTVIVRGQINKIKEDVKNFIIEYSPRAEGVDESSFVDTDVIELTNYPYDTRKNDHISFNGKVTTFSKLKIGKGVDKNQHYNLWFEIDNTNVTLYYHTDSSSLPDPVISDTIAHGLTISEMININIVHDNDGAVNFIMQSGGGSFTHKFVGNGRTYYNTRGAIRAVSDGTTLTDVKLSATCSDFKCPIWVFGASYTNVADNQTVGALKGFGYFDYYLNGFAGREALGAYNDLVRSLSYSCPKVITFGYGFMINTASYDTWKSYIDSVINLCREKGITLVFALDPDVKTKDLSQYRQYIIDSGYRYIDLKSAVQQGPYVYDTDFWYPGFMSSDGVHPTPLGAKAMAMQVLRDFPEIMQC